MNSQRDPCAGCVYQTLVGGYLICDYISITGHRRLCPFGVGCTVKQTEESDTMSKKKWDTETARKLWQEGKSDPEIAAAMDVSTTTVFQWRKREGLAATSPPAFVPKSQTAPASEVTPEAEDTQEVELRDGPVELDLEFCGGWARLRAPGWEQAAKLWRMMDVCVEALSAGAGHG